MTELNLPIRGLAWEGSFGSGRTIISNVKKFLQEVSLPKITILALIFYLHWIGLKYVQQYTNSKSGKQNKLFNVFFDQSFGVRVLVASVFKLALWNESIKKERKLWNHADCSIQSNAHPFFILLYYHISDAMAKWLRHSCSNFFLICHLGYQIHGEEVSENVYISIISTIRF